MTSIRLQGTDGIRREIKRAKQLPGVSPQKAFLKHGVLTEEFMELYAYAHATQVFNSAHRTERPAIVIGWDPRDPDGVFTSSVVRGVRRANCDAWVLGVVPTPLVPLYMLYEQGSGGMMVTASHNPPDQNGIKIFNGYRGLKPFPKNDATLSRRILSLDYAQIHRRPLSGKLKDCRDDALALFRKFSLAPENAWFDHRKASDSQFRNWALVVDPANGSLSKLAAPIFRKAGFGHVYEVNNGAGAVNRNGGVADLEGCRVISQADALNKEGKFFTHQAVRKLFQLASRFAKELKSGKKRLAGAVFDADADRFYKLDYDPAQQCVHVSGGDDTAYLQARFFSAKQAKGARFVNTVESDLNVSGAVEALGLQSCLTAVGDKWIQLQFAKALISARIGFLNDHEIPLSASLLEQWEELSAGVSPPDVAKLQKLEHKLNALIERAGHSPDAVDATLAQQIVVGSEETGHNITPGRLELKNGKRAVVFFGSGLKSALNTFAAEHDAKQTKFRAFRPPFRQGFKATLYAYYVKKELFAQDSAIWKQIKKEILKSTQAKGWESRVVDFPEDPDMLYVEAKPGGKRRAGIFVRNSGTENKIGINLRGAMGDTPALKLIGESLIRILMQSMKDESNELCRLEAQWVERLATRAHPSEPQDMEPLQKERLLNEMLKQGLVQPGPNGPRLTKRGQWFASLARAAE
ncbi:MAG: hypothetical protein G3M78_01705 [Candidatus Nitrohelix vancouverensis]|uniref:Alpha-D-phosphohexomutase alpha/beta/alpha domain-containing protein n=1 Tax=Candidatus Nitrohelix vancouverensis TaxID=2705534 RepID=A0A7T0C0C7_9BACT|nr:MAG: hypothetical protein G3M78_01705 [Candidatus Nitrohelix vancouverensis]